MRELASSAVAVAPGMVVRVVGIKSQWELNHQLGIVEKVDAEAPNKFHVILGSGYIKSIRATNLQPYMGASNVHFVQQVKECYEANRAWRKQHRTDAREHFGL